MEPHPYPHGVPRAHSFEFGTLYFRLMFCFVLIYASLLISCVAVVVVIVVLYGDRIGNVKGKNDVCLCHFLTSSLCSCVGWRQEFYTHHFVSICCSRFAPWLWELPRALPPTPCLCRFAPFLLLNHLPFLQESLSTSLYFYALTTLFRVASMAADKQIAWFLF